jgi:hypothetical protein
VAPLEAADAWIGQYRAFFSARLDRLDEQLKTMMAAKTPTADSSGKGEDK